MNTIFYNLKSFLRRIIFYKWLLLSFILIGLSLSSCNRYASVRSNNKAIAKKVNKEEENKSEEQSKENIQSEEFAELKKQIVKNEIEPVKKLPTINEQLAKLAEEQTIFKSKLNDITSDVSNVKTDIIEIKGTLVDIKNAINTYYNNKPREAITGVKPPLIEEKKSEEKSEQSYEDYAKKDKKKEYIILSDEKIASNKSEKAKPSENAESKPSKKDNSVKTENTLTKRKANRLTNDDRKALANAIKEKAKQEQVKIDLEPQKAVAQNAKPEIEEFKNAMTKISKKDYMAALNELQNAIKKEKDVIKRSECNYWIGESHFGLKQFDKAVESFMKVLNTARNSRQDDAQAMIAESQLRAGLADKAKQSFSTLISKYPESEFVPRARKMLQQL